MPMNILIESLSAAFVAIISSLLFLNIIPFAKLVVGKNSGIARKIDAFVKAAQSVTFLFVLSDTAVKKHRTGPYK